MNRLDEIERTAKLGTDCGYFIGEFAFHDILALVAVARATIKCRRIRIAMARVRDEEWDRLASQLLEAETEEAQALAPLLARPAIESGTLSAPTSGTVPDAGAG